MYVSYHMIGKIIVQMCLQQQTIVVYMFYYFGMLPNVDIQSLVLKMAAS